MNFLKRMVVFLVLFTIGSSYLAYGLEKEKVLDIGLVLRLKDQFNDTIAGIMKGIETAQVLFERNHPQVKVRFHRYPHGEGLAAVLRATDQVIQDKIHAVIGGELSEESWVLREQFRNKNIVFITPTSSFPGITEGVPYAFRACLSDRKVATGLAQFTQSRIQPKSLGVVHNVSSVYTGFETKQFLETFRSYENGVPVTEEKVMKYAPSYEPIIKKFMAKRVTHVVIFTHPSDFMRFVTQSESLGFFPIYIGSDGWGSNEHIYQNLVSNLKYKNKFVAYRHSFWKEDLATPISKEFQSLYVSMHKGKPTAWSAVGFDAAWILMIAMTQVNPVKQSHLSAVLQQSLESIQNLSLVTHESFSFGPDHSPLSGLHIYKINMKGIHHEVSLP